MGILYSLNNEKNNMKNKKPILFVFGFLLVFLFSLTINLESVKAASYSKTIFIDDYVIDYNYQDAISESYFTLKINITNNKNSARNLTLKMQEDDPFEFKDSRRWDIENLNSSQSVSKNFVIYVDKAESKKYFIEFNLKDNEDDWDEKFEIKVSTNSPEFSLGEISSSPKKMVPGQTGVALSITIKNIGDYKAEDVVADLKLPQDFSFSGSYSNELHLGDIDKGVSKTLVFYFDIDEKIEEKNYSATLTLNYKNDGESEKKEITIPLTIFSIPRFEIIKIEELSKLYPGSKSKIKVYLKDIGKDAKDVTLRVYQRSDQPFEFTEKSVYIGSLKSNEIGYGVFEFTIDKKAESMKYYLDFQLRSVDGDNVIVKELSYPLTVSKKESNFDLYLILSIGLLLILIVIVLLKNKNRKR